MRSNRTTDFLIKKVALHALKPVIHLGEVAFTVKGLKMRVRSPKDKEKLAKVEAKLAELKREMGLT